VQLAERLAVSRGPVREALQRLIQEGLLRDERHRGVFVVELDADDVADIYFARAAAEHAAIRTHIARGPADVAEALAAILEQMRGAADSKDWSTLADADLHFHEVLVGSTGSKRLMRMFGTLMAETRMCLTRLQSHYPQWQDLVQEHAAIVDALRRADEPAALAVIDAHFASSVVELSDGGAAPARVGRSPR
jgi:DNA-binding GntR family transcriptional regulator